MDDLISIQLNYQNLYSFGAYHSGFDLFDSLYLENRTNREFASLKVRIRTMPNILLNEECIVDFLAPFAHRSLSCDWMKPDLSAFAEIKRPLDVTVFVSVLDQGENIIHSEELSCKLLPYDYFTGIDSMPESLAFLVTPNQGELKQFDEFLVQHDPLAGCRMVYDAIKTKKMTYSSEDYSSSKILPVRLCERILRDRNANALEFGLLFASVCERAGYSPVLVFAGKGKVFSGFCTKLHSLPLLKSIPKNKKDFDDLYLIDCSYFAYGSELDFDSALFHSKNWLNLTDENVLMLSIATAREYHLIPLPNRSFENGAFAMEAGDDVTLKGSFNDYYSLMKEYAQDSRITSYLTGKKVPITPVQKSTLGFQPDLDVNQNKVLSKVLSNDITLISARPGTGVSTVFARAAEHEMRNGRRVLYITDPKYHCGCFEEICKKSFDRSFIWNLMEDSKKILNKSDFNGIFQYHDDIFKDRDTVRNSQEKMDSYYSDLEGDKRIVSSFLLASDRYHQLRDANDAIIFSPEQVGLLSDELVHSWFGIANDAVRVLCEIGSVSDNPLRLIQKKEFSYEYKSQLIRQLEELLSCVESICALRDQLSPLFPSLDGFKSRWALRAFNDLTGLFGEFDHVPVSFFEDPSKIEEYFRTVTNLIQAKNENDVIAETIKVSFDERIFDLDASDLYNRYQSLLNDKGLKVISMRYSILKSVKRYLLPNCDVENMEYILSRLDCYQKNLELIHREKDSAFRLLSVTRNGNDGAWDDLQYATDLCYQGSCIFQNFFPLDKIFEFVCDFCKATEIPGVKEKTEKLRIYEEEYSKLVSGLDQMVSNQTEHFYQGSDEDYFSMIHRSLAGVLSSVDGIKNWCSWLSIKDLALQNGMKNMVLAVESGKVLPEELKRSFLRAFFKAVCEYNFIAHPNLVPGHFDLKEEQSVCRSAMEGLNEKKKAELNSILSNNRFQLLNDLDEEFSSHSILQEDPSTFAKIFPCIISDIQEAKRYFRSQRQLFDLILIEDRSDLSLSDLIWVFSAGKKVAYAGAFSTSYRKEPANFDLSLSAFDYLWPLTDEKYRFSACYNATPALTANKASYIGGIRSDFRTYFVPATCAEKAMDCVFVSGTYGGEYPRSNFLEAQCVVDTMLRFLLDEKEKSIQVIAFTDEQKMLILRLIAQKIKHQEELGELFRNTARVVITSINESIEFTDVVLVSTTFAPDRSQHGARLPFEFFEFAGKDPKKMMEFILSSAREKLILITGFHLDELKHTSTFLPCLQAVKILLSEAGAPLSNHTYSACGALDGDSVILHLGDEISKRGFRVSFGVQSGRYYLDLAVADSKGTFLLGIVSDRTVLNQKSNVSAIEMSNLEAFCKADWQIYRLHAANTFDSFDGELDRILLRLPSNQEQVEII